MKKLFSILILSFCFQQTFSQTANAGADKTIYLTQTSTVTLDGSASSGTSYQWTEVSTDFMSGGSITSSASKTTTVTGLKAGTFYFKIAVTTGGSTNVDTMVVRVEVSPPPNGTLYRHFDMSAPSILNAINDRYDTTNYYPTGGPRSSAGEDPNRYYLFRDRLPNMEIDAQRGKLLNQNVDGYAGEEGVAGGYPRTELQLCDACFRFDTTKTYMFEWKGYFPQNTNWMVLDDDPDWSALLVIWQTHGFKYDYAIANFELAHDGTINFVNEITGDTTELSDTYVKEKVQVGTLDSFYNKSQTIRITMREGLSDSAFIKVEVNGVQRYYRRGRVGSAFFDDYVKFGGVYDWRSWMTSGDSLSRGRRWGLVTESFKVYQLETTPVEPPAATSQYWTRGVRTEFENK